MPKTKINLHIKLDLLKPQGNPEKFFTKLIHWLLSSGRFIFVFVEALVLIAFAARFKIDADLAAKKEAIEEQIPYIESLKPYELLIREVQLKLLTINNTRKNSPDWPNIFKKIADQTPAGIKINSINLEKSVDIANIHITGQTTNNYDLTSFTTGLKSDPAFNSVNLIGVGLEQGIIKFTIDASAKAIDTGGKGV